MAWWNRIDGFPQTFKVDEEQWIVTHFVQYKRGDCMLYRMLLPIGITDHRRVLKDSKFYIDGKQQSYKYGDSIRCDDKGNPLEKDWIEGDLKKRFKTANKKGFVNAKKPQPKRYWGVKE